MNLRQLEVFHAVMQTGNMSTAARLVCITPSAVSKTIAHTELQLGYPLFTRTRGALAPTPEAMVLFGESMTIHGKLDELRKIAANLLQTDHGRVRLAALPAISHDCLPGVLAQHARLYPQIKVEVRTSHQDQMAQALLTRTVDFALGCDEHRHPQLSSHALVSGPLYVVATKDIWQRATRARRHHPMEFLAGTPLVRLMGDDPLRGPVDRLARELGITGESALQVQTGRLALELVRRGLGWTVVDFLTSNSLDTQSMVALHLEHLPQIPMCAYHVSTQPPSQHALRMLALIKQQLTTAATRSQSTARVCAWDADAQTPSVVA